MNAIRLPDLGTAIRYAVQDEHGRGCAVIRRPEARGWRFHAPLGRDSAATGLHYWRTRHAEILLALCEVSR